MDVSPLLEREDFDAIESAGDAAEGLGAATTRLSFDLHKFVLAFAGSIGISRLADWFARRLAH